MKEMKHVSIQIGDAFYRKFIYGIGDDVQGNKLPPRPMIHTINSLKRLLLSKVPVLASILFPHGEYPYLVLVFICLIVLFIARPKSIKRVWKKPKLTKRRIFGGLAVVILIISYFSIAFWIGILLELINTAIEVTWHNLSLWRSAEKNLKSLEMDLQLIVHYLVRLVLMHKA
ncbi:hypothetical protein RJT34_23631 [Clitoria ternatea]|uniref:Uncharacterized protein n=1 Tax=Clitoria ternatea TaxID=43366 RepID=A0AAN9FN12_CLITE